jgi:hypothetical protein
MEPFCGRYFGLVNVEGDDPSPVAMFRDNEDATRELARRQALPEEDDDHLTEYHQVLACHVAGVLWNSYEADPRIDSALTAAEIAREHGVVE